MLFTPSRHQIEFDQQISQSKGLLKNQGPKIITHTTVHPFILPYKNNQQTGTIKPRLHGQPAALTISQGCRYLLQA